MNAALDRIQRLPKLEDLIPQLRSQGIELPPSATVGTFGDSDALCEELLVLIRDGRKRAGASLLWAHEAEAESPPQPGDVEVVVDHHGRPSLVTRVTAVEVVPFKDVTAAFAAREGEGDGSLEYWREAHWRFFSRECERIGRTATQDMPVVCCTFEVLHVLPTGHAQVL